ncbi:MBOAT-domain-containing protein [Linderina pennispora]|uniref:MBOAT-domain-containing protein n=1 Tax=Linderina pennispora TaxID=61395 RepID=A0A1Y1WKU5_9FUNG|nr:MBOAT-domain-containing protein [Linderina pennispora]ORX74112.1 MBOAT-domain-containing protein [Linderina pennispora]
MRALNTGFTWLSANYLGGIPIDRIATVASVLFSYALAHVFRRIPASNAPLRHVFSIASTLFLFGAVQEQYIGLAHLLVGSLVIYGMMKTLKGALMPRAVFFVAMLHMSFSQLRRQWGESGTVSFDYTGAQMVFVIKVTSLAYCVYDGTCDPKTLSAYQRKNAIGGVPSLLEFLGYVSFFPGFAVGPAFELATYRRMISFNNRQASRQVNARAYTTLLVGMFWVAVVVVYGDRFSFGFMTTDDFSQWSFARKAVFMGISGVVTRGAYYAAWKMSEGACMLAGLGFDGYCEDGSIAWLDIANVRVFDVESSSSLKAMIDAWNIGTNTWLRHHVYMRLNQGSGSSSHATLLTFLVSAWWHGFYPWLLPDNLRPLVVSKEDDMEKRRPPVKIMYDLVGWIMSKFTLDFVVVPFMLLNIAPSITAWRNLYMAVPVSFKVLGAGQLLKPKTT